MTTKIYSLSNIEESTDALSKGLLGFTMKLNQNVNDTSWQKEFLNMKSHSPSDAKLLMGGVKGLKGAWRLGVLHVEYERLKKEQEQQQQ